MGGVMRLVQRRLGALGWEHLIAGPVLWERGVVSLVCVALLVSVSVNVFASVSVSVNWFLDFIFVLVVSQQVWYSQLSSILANAGISLLHNDMTPANVTHSLPPLPCSFPDSPT
ncbi:hypothetical protein N5P37_010510 [Trichoderma harzianum]|uniref:Uncharacterized protein n=1 Tax=Trichoderma harzianum CBS 226.95 TaxID=983964 RepID=A0A2T4A0L7_TRIHA|nr:hypothetical protein M431DRAFT_485929 [Trichoderma harzianum CBS 226.95]KAK0756985.1 hypothetical protein N5P37_010510 [Trichoderma harzianum]PKK48651.1 hypothetical protein CI102_6588 [Trichoderma harzianum]PTB50568.1 hypothetical protein M431DRAFT_485929 [Trichoderma harzianum CBS 226.95]